MYYCYHSICGNDVWIAGVAAINIDGGTVQVLADLFVKLVVELVAVNGF